jgi:hypothetical protein
MKSIYKFIAGNSRVTPVGLAVAAILAYAFRDRLGWWSAAVYLLVLLVTLGLSVFETVI